MIDIKVIDKNKTIVKGKRLVAAIEEPRELYARWGAQGLKWIDENFIKQGGLLKEGKWKGIKEETKKRRRKGRRGAKLGKKILINTGELRKSFTLRFSNDGVYLGTEKKYAKYHDSDAPRKKLPQRRVLPRQKDDTLTTRLKRSTINYLKAKSKGIIK